MKSMVSELFKIGNVTATIFRTYHTGVLTGKRIAKNGHTLGIRIAPKALVLIRW